MTPLDVEQMTLDQIYVMILDMNALTSERGLITGTPQSLAQRKLIAPRPRESLFQKVMREGSVHGDDRKAKRARRAERLRNLKLARGN